MKEFYWNTERSMLLCEDLKTGEVTHFSELPRSFIIQADLKLKELFADVYNELLEWTGSGIGNEYGRLYQFCACNFSQKDSRPDIDDDFNFVPERVSCPVRHHCHWHICNPTLTNVISAREKDIIRLFVKYTEEEIAERLFISPATVHNHISHIYAKLGFAGKAAPKQLVDYAHHNKIVN